MVITTTNWILVILAPTYQHYKTDGIWRSWFLQKERILCCKKPMNQTYYKMVCDVYAFFVHCVHEIYSLSQKRCTIHEHQNQIIKEKIVQKTESYITHHFSQKNVYPQWLSYRWIVGQYTTEPYDHWFLQSIMMEMSRWKQTSVGPCQKLPCFSVCVGFSKFRKR